MITEGKMLFLRHSFANYCDVILHKGYSHIRFSQQRSAVLAAAVLAAAVLAAKQYNFSPLGYDFYFHAKIFHCACSCPTR
jgi:hypothetical protein